MSRSASTQRLGPQVRHAARCPDAASTTTRLPAAALGVAARGRRRTLGSPGVAGAERRDGGAAAEDAGEGGYGHRLGVRSGARGQDDAAGTRARASARMQAP